MVPGDTNGSADIFVRDVLTGQTTRVSLASDGTQANADRDPRFILSTGHDPQISADGRFVAFSSAASNLISGDTNGTRDIFVHNRLTGQTVRASVAADAGVSLLGSGSLLHHKSLKRPTKLIPTSARAAAPASKNHQASCRAPRGASAC